MVSFNIKKNNNKIRDLGIRGEGRVDENRTAHHSTEPGLCGQGRRNSVTSCEPTEGSTCQRLLRVKGRCGTRGELKKLKGM